MTFIDQRLPQDYTFDAIASDEWMTEIVENIGRVESRNSPSSNPRRSWDLSTAARTQTQKEELHEWFLAMRGQLHSFAFLDPADNSVARQVIATADGATVDFQIIKSYTIGGATYERSITKPVTAGVSVWVNNVLQSSGYTVSRTTGIITFSVAPTDTYSIEAAVTQFDVPVRFAESRLAWTAVNRNIVNGLIWVCSSLKLIEVIGE